MAAPATRVYSNDDLEALPNGALARERLKQAKLQGQQLIEQSVFSLYDEEGKYLGFALRVAEHAHALLMQTDPKHHRAQMLLPPAELRTKESPNGAPAYLFAGGTDDRTVYQFPKGSFLRNRLSVVVFRKDSENGEKLTAITQEEGRVWFGAFLGTPPGIEMHGPVSIEELNEEYSRSIGRTFGVYPGQFGPQRVIMDESLGVVGFNLGWITIPLSEPRVRQELAWMFSTLNPPPSDGAMAEIKRLYGEAPTMYRQAKSGFASQSSPESK